MSDMSTFEKARKPLKDLKWRIGAMLVWLALFVMGLNDFYVRSSALDGLWFIGVILFIVLFRRYHRGQTHMRDPYQSIRCSDSRSTPFPPRVGNYGGYIF